MRVTLAFLLAPALALADPTPPAIAQAEANLRTMEGNAARVRHMLSSARRTSSPATPCLDAALSRADATVRAGREEARLAAAALEGGNAEQAKHQAALLAVQRDASRDASHAADACLLPADAAPSDQTVIRIEVDPRLPSDSVVFGKP